MKSLLIKDTTVSERAQIVREALGADGDCEDIDLSDMYDDYIYGLKELAEINREFTRTDGAVRAEPSLLDLCRVSTEEDDNQIRK